MKTVHKLLLYVVLLFAIMGQPAQAEQWVRVAEWPSYPYLHKIRFNGNIGIIVGSVYILKSTDAGNTWAFKFIDTSGHEPGQYPWYSDICWPDPQNPQIIFVCGGNFLARSSDGGETWTSGSLFSGCTDHFWSMSFVNASTGYISGNDTLFRTTDGGISWTNVYPTRQQNLDSYFFNASTGIIATIYEARKTTNGGISWQVVCSSLQMSSAPLAVYFYDASLGFISGDLDMIMRTTNGGNNWQKIRGGGIARDLWDIAFYDQNLGFIVGGHTGGTSGFISKTTNGGLNWSNYYIDTVHGTDHTLKSVAINYLGFAFAVTEGIVYRTTSSVDLQHISSEIPAGYALKQNYPNPFNPRTVIEFSLRKKSAVKLRIYDMQGREIQILVDEVISAGSYRVDFNGELFSSGVYFYSLESEDYRQTKKMLLLK